jgi:amino acid adenylation domain-containing protein
VPEAVALSCEGQHVTYAELNARANTLAHRLRELRIGPDVLVGLCAERSIALVVGILAILKAGGAYVPLDPDSPPERLRFLLEDSGLKVLLSQSTVTERLPEVEVDIVDLEEGLIVSQQRPEGPSPTLPFRRGEPERGWAPDERGTNPTPHLGNGGLEGVSDSLASPDNLPGGAAPENVAYVIYTSGSTGKPKGVPVTHANVFRLFTATQRWFHFNHNDVWPLFHSFAFDFSVWEIWGALLYGGRLVIVPYWVSRSPSAFLALLREEGVTVLNQTPSAFRQLVRADEEAGAAPEDLALRHVIFGGEALDVQGLRPWFDRHGDRLPRLVNMYGITETTVHVTYRPLTRADLAEPVGGSPIGRPIPDLRVYLLDKRLQPVPVGIVGELFVGGAGVARGYLARPGLTAERFVPDPFAAGPGARLYRSGDLARRRTDGGLEFLGRSDRQVKIRGHRIELGEIESALSAHMAVREVAVVAHDAGPGDKRLVAYLAWKTGRGIPQGELRAWLETRLPEPMRPAAFVFLEALPLTTNGKLDVRALPAPDWSRRSLAAAFVAPRNAAEEVIAGTWAAVLGIERVGVHDDFFALGGHSLLAVQVMARLRDAFTREIALRTLFEARTVASLAARIQSEASHGVPLSREETPIERVTRDGPLPLSFAQQALWFLDQLTPGEPVFHVTASARVRGPLDLDALETALREIVDRHEVLRTTFTVHDGQPVQVIAPRGDVRLRRIDLPSRDEPEAARIASEEARRPFDLARGPLVRALAIGLGPEDHVVLLTMHHIVTDGWSMGVAARELAALYDACRHHRPLSLPPLPFQYSDFAAWQRSWLRDEVLEALLDYWTRRLEGLAPLELPTDRPRPAVRSTRGAARSFTLSAELTQSLRDLGHSEGATLFMTLLAAFQALLHRLSGQFDVAIGTPVANRSRPALEGLIGYFVNMLVLRSDLRGDPPFRTLLGRVRETALGAFEHQDLPFDRLIEVIAPQRDPARSPLFQVMFVLQNNRLPDVGLGGLVLEAPPAGEGTGTAKFDLTLALEETDRGMIGSFEYRTDLFVDATIEHLVERLRAMLEAIVSDPDRRLSELPLLTEGERRSLLDRQTPEVPIPETCIQGLFEAQAARTPEATALEHQGESLTYAGLNQRANDLAGQLRGRGVGPESRVGIAVERGPELAVGILGILKAGAAYVPLDPTYPRDRLGFMLEDSDISVVLTQEHLRKRLPETRAEILDLFSPQRTQKTQSGDKSLLSVSSGLKSPPVPQSAAYVIYTSGSTGKPAGALVTQRGLVNHCLAAASLFELCPSDRVLQFSSISFDIAVEELFPAWAVGATVVPRGGDDTLEPAVFTRWIERERITVLDLPTAYWHAWVDALAARKESPPESLRLVVVGGEKASPRAFARWREITGGRIRWINTYGPTETTVIATAHEPAAGAEVDDAVPIGRPIANARIYLLDHHLQLVPRGQPGELYIGGAGLARGYVNRPGLTAERFVPDPFAAEPGSRLFRTGDVARWRADGTIEFLHRRDDQAKIGGFRVDPSEVESALLEHPAVREAVVVVRPTDAGEARLAGYVVMHPQETVAATELRRALRARLPRYMVPTSMMRLEALPLTTSGKVDRAALPVPDVTSGDVDRIAPRDALEARLAALWAEVLGQNQVGVRENFFDLGGHSLLAIRLLSRIEDELQVRLPLSALFFGATIEELAALLRARAEGTPDSPLVAIQPRGEKPPFVCVHPAGGIVYCFQELARHLGTDRPFYGIQASGLEGDQTPVDRIERMAAGYVEALRKLRPEGPYHLGGWSMGGLVAYEMACQLRASGEDVGTLAILDTPAPPRRGGPEPVTRALAQQLAALARGTELFAAFGGDSEDPAREPDLLADAALLVEMARDLALGFGGDPRRLFEHLRSLSPVEQRDLVLRHFRLHEVYSLETGPERVQRLWNVLRASIGAAARYAARPYRGHMVVFRASDRPGVRGVDPALGWGTLAENGVSVHVIAGDHASILRSPAVADLAAALRGVIDGFEEAGAP